MDTTLAVFHSCDSNLRVEFFAISGFFGFVFFWLVWSFIAQVSS